MPTAPSIDPEALTFPKAIEQILDGRKVRRAVWDPEQCLLRCTVTATGWAKDPAAGVFLAIRHPSGKIDAYIVKDEDLVATDWALVREN